MYVKESSFQELSIKYVFHLECYSKPVIYISIMIYNVKQINNNVKQTPSLMRI